MSDYEFDTRYEIYAPDDYDRAYALGANSARAAFSKAKRLMRERGLDLVLVTDNVHGIEMALSFVNERWVVSHRLHDYHWQSPEAGLVTQEEADVFRGGGTPEVRESLLAKRREAERAALRDISRASKTFGTGLTTRSLDFGEEDYYRSS